MTALRRAVVAGHGPVALCLHGRPELPAAAAGRPAGARVQGDDGTGDRRRRRETFRPAQPRDAIDRGPWWTMYGDPVLDRVAAQVDISNQTLMQAEAAYRQARALVRQDASGLYPTIGGNAGYTQSGSGTGSGRSTQGGIVSTGSGSLEPIHHGPVAQLAGRPVGAHPAPDRKRSRRPPRRAPPTSPTPGCRRRPTWRSTTSRCASPSSASSSSRPRWRPSRARPRSCRTSSTPASSRGVDLAQAQTQLEQTRAQLVAENINRADVRACGRGPGRQGAGGFQPGARAAARRGADTRRRRAVGAARAAARHRLGRAPDGVGQRPDRRGRRPPTIPTSRSPAPSPWWPAACMPLLQLSNAVWSVGPQLAATLVDGGALKAQVEGARAKYDGQVALYRQTILVAFQQVEDALVQQRVLVDAGAGAAPRSRLRARGRAAVAQPVHTGHGALHHRGDDRRPPRSAPSRACSMSA